MIFAILFTDNDEKADMRQHHMKEHLAFLDQHKSQVQAAGPLTDASDGTAAGGLWLVQCDTVEDARKLVETDPFWPTGLRKSVRILQWNQVFTAQGASQG